MKTLVIYALLSTISLTGIRSLSAAASDSEKKATTTAENKKTNSKDSKKSANKKGSDDAKTKTKPASTHKLKKGLFEIKVELSGIFDAVKASPLSLAPKKWPSLSVMNAVAHGTEVEKGDLLVQLETDKLEKAIRSAELGQALSELSLKLAELELVELEKSTPLTLASRRRAKQQSQEDLAYFKKTDRTQREKSAKQTLKQSSQYLSYAKEELDQLQKMYAADDLTEETEEIIVTRAKNSVDGAQFRLESIKLSTQRTLETTLPREQQNLLDRVESSAIAWDKSSKSLPQALKKKRLDVEKMKYDQQQNIDQLRDMKTDLLSFAVKAPHDGIVYYGADTRGKWSSASMLQKKLNPGGKLMPHEVFMTVVQSQDLQVLSPIPENKLALLEKGLSAKITPVATPDTSLDGELAEMRRVPLTTGAFPSTLKITSDTKGLYPGMTCKVLFEIYKNEEALTAPKKAVTTENGESFVRLKDGKKQRVKTGRSDGKVIEILSGLKEGDEIEL